MTSSIGSKSRSGRRRPFTLLELIVVLALLGGLMAVATPSLRGMLHGRRADEEARRLLALLHWAPVEAASRGEILLVWIDPEAGEYGLMTAAEEQTQRYQGTVADSLDISMNQEAIGLDGITTIVAWPEGTLTCDTPCTITIEQRNLNRVLNIVFDEEEGTFSLEVQP